jgi:hypothetical protein
MRKLVLVTLLSAGVIQSGAGCIFSSDDDDDDDGVPSDDGDDDGDDGGPGECGESFVGILYNPTWLCPEEAEDITFFAFPEGGNGSLDPDTFACDAVQPPDICYDPGTYDIEVVPENSAGDSFAPLFDVVTGGDGDLIETDFEFTNDGGFFQLAWTIEGLAPEDACAEGEEVEVSAIRLEDKSLKLVDSAPCTDGIATFPADAAGWPLGTYELDVVLVDADGMPQSEPGDIIEDELLFGDELRDLGDVDLLPVIEK